MAERFDAIIILGGGRTNDGNLTTLSRQRLDEGLKLYKEGVALKIFALGGYYSTYNPNSIAFDISGAKIRSDYLIARGANPNDVVLVEDGRDTIYEAFASREKAKELGLKRLLVVTSDKHLERAIYIYKRIFGKSFEIEGQGIPCGDLLNETEEKEYLHLVQIFFASFPEEIPMPVSWEDWYAAHKKLYDSYKEIHTKYIGGGKETNQAYMGIKQKRT